MTPTALTQASLWWPQTDPEEGPTHIIPPIYTHDTTQREHSLTLPTSMNSRMDESTASDSFERSQSYEDDAPWNSAGNDASLSGPSQTQPDALVEGAAANASQDFISESLNPTSLDDEAGGPCLLAEASFSVAPGDVRSADDSLTDDFQARSAPADASLLTVQPSTLFAEPDESLARSAPSISPLDKTFLGSDEDKLADDSFTKPLPADASPQRWNNSLDASVAQAPMHSPNMSLYFYDPQSPQVCAPPNALAPPAPLLSINESSPVSSPTMRSGETAGLRAPFAPTQRANVPTQQSSKKTVKLPVQGGSPVRVTTRRRPTSIRRTVTTALVPDENASIPAPVPGFGTFELDRKVLPCFPVKSDGLMRVTPATLRELMLGRYDDQIRGFQIIDCRFAYEHQGGHIAGSVNLHTVHQIRQYCLTPGTGLHEGRPLPSRTQSGQADETGDARKFVLVFHCEFSCKRGPTMALALRQADRSLASDYPRCHFPDVYVLQGGYADFFAASPDLCEPRAYVPMDDPRFGHHRSAELNGFRKQFSRNRSFAYGDSQSFGSALAQRARRSAALFPQAAAPARAHAPGPAPKALGLRRGASVATASLAPPGPENQRDASFSSAGESSFEADVGDSPCAAASRRPSFAPPARATFARRPLKRAETTSVVVFPM